MADVIYDGTGIRLAGIRYRFKNELITDSRLGGMKLLISLKLERKVDNPLPSPNRDLHSQCALEMAGAECQLNFYSVEKVDFPSVSYR